MGDPKLAKSFARDIGLMKEVGIYPIVVHGGGPQIANRLKTKNITSQFIEGLRVTDIETVKVVEDVLGNEINGEIVKAISDSGGKAIGLSGNKNNQEAIKDKSQFDAIKRGIACLLYTSPSPRDAHESRMPSSA